MPDVSITPFMWVALSTVVAVYPVWQEPQAVFCAWGAGGGAPWQAAQPATCEGPPVHDGEVTVPPAFSVAPWQ
jgi:hypothetical protein